MGLLLNVWQKVVLVAKNEDDNVLSWDLRPAMEVFVLENKAVGEENVAEEMEKAVDAIWGTWGE